MYEIMCVIICIGLVSYIITRESRDTIIIPVYN